MQAIKEKDLETVCSECGKAHKMEWKSEWCTQSAFSHYITFDCDSCGYKIWLKTAHDSSGI